MTDQKNIIYLADYTSKKSSINTIKHFKAKDSLSEPKAHLLKRIFALGIDYFAIAIIKDLFYVVYSLTIFEFMAPLGDRYKDYLVNSENIALHLSIFMIVYFTYFLFCSYVLEGKTLGKFAMGLRVINEKFVTNPDELSTSLSLEQCLYRAGGYLTCYLSFGVLFIFNFASEDKKGLPDYFSNSRTVSDSWIHQMYDYKNHQQEHVLIEISSLDIAS